MSDEQQLLARVRQAATAPTNTVHADVTKADLLMVVEMVEAAHRQIAEARTERAMTAEHMSAYAQRAERERYEPQLAASVASETALRRLLWLRHGHQSLYGDDGEMQCGTCTLDFTRADIEEIEQILITVPSLLPALPVTAAPAARQAGDDS